MGLISSIYGKKLKYPVACCGDEWQAGGLFPWKNPTPYCGFLQCWARVKPINYFFRNKN
jgi:hypothetical protein